MKEILTNIASLIKVKTLVTIVVMILFSVEVIKGNISSEYLNNIVIMVVAFYFGTQTEKSAQFLK